LNWEEEVFCGLLAVVVEGEMVFGRGLRICGRGHSHVGHCVKVKGWLFMVEVVGGGRMYQWHQWRGGVVADEC
jgi:hypothetical protein